MYKNLEDYPASNESIETEKESLEISFKEQVEILKLETLIKYKFINIKWIRLARTHSSFVDGDKSLSNERLEFLGDNVIKMILADHLFTYSNMDEGDMTNQKITLENNRKLAHLAKELNLENFLITSKSVQNISDNMLADFIESIVGAIYKDGGFETAREFVLRHFA
jgi:ribonuclease III